MSLGIAMSATPHMPFRPRPAGRVAGVSRRAVLAGLLALCAPSAGRAAAPSPAEPAGRPASPFPLSVERGKRHLVGADGRPFLIIGDSAWSMIAELTRDEVVTYLSDRRARGFNTVLVSLVEHKFARKAPANIYGDQPFLAPGDFGRPNEAYFAHADWVLRKARDMGLLVLLAPSFLGAHGTDEGWYGELVKNSREALRSYGAYIGSRYRGLDNIMWLQGCDLVPPDKSVVEAIAEGVRAADPKALQTAQGAPGTQPVTFFAGRRWLDLNTVYTYGSVREASLEAYRRPGAMPFFLVESGYENEHDTPVQGVRAEAWQAILTGATGQVFGNNPMWHFSGPGIFPAPAGWQKSLDSDGAKSMTALSRLLSGLEWWRLVPQAGDGFIRRGAFEQVLDALTPADASAPVAALADDGSFALVYVQGDDALTLGLDGFAAGRLTARWYDPAAGIFADTDMASFPAKGSRRFTPPPPHRGGSDWLLLIRETV